MKKNMLKIIAEKTKNLFNFRANNECREINLKNLIEEKINKNKKEKLNKRLFFSDLNDEKYFCLSEREKENYLFEITNTIWQHKENN